MHSKNSMTLQVSFQLNWAPRILSLHSLPIVSQQFIAIWGISVAPPQGSNVAMAFHDSHFHNLLSFSWTGMDPATNSKSNHCLDAAKACNLNDNCKRLRSGYISTCNKSYDNYRCNRRKCHKALRQFFDRVPSEYTYRMLFCSCKDQACAERRRQTIVPDCSYEDKEKPNCLDLRNQCRSDPLCRWGSYQFLPPLFWICWFVWAPLGWLCGVNILICGALACKTAFVQWIVSF